MEDIKINSFSADGKRVELKHGINFLFIGNQGSRSLAIDKLKYAFGLNRRNREFKERVALEISIGKSDLSIERVPNSKELKITNNKEIKYFDERSYELAEYYCGLLKPWFFMKGPKTDILKILDFYFFDALSDNKSIDNHIINLMFGINEKREVEVDNELKSLKARISNLELTVEAVESFSKELIKDFKEDGSEAFKSIVENKSLEYRKTFKEQVDSINELTKEFKYVSERIDHIKSKVYKIFTYEVNSGFEKFNVGKLEGLADKINFTGTESDSQLIIQGLVIRVMLFLIERQFICNTPGFILTNLSRDRIDRKLNKEVTFYINDLVNQNNKIQYIEFIKNQENIMGDNNIIYAKGIF